ncbi:MAG: hypothetical protein H0V81_15095 [Solirubrobacterales bacterium]|nr:hypothetical protein [Solirubrobacterales bacterium]
MLLASALAVAATANPCADPEPRYACPDLVMRAPYNMKLIRTPKRQLLAATNAIVNVGDGPLEVRGTRTQSSRFQIPARQVLRGRTTQTAPLVLPPRGRLNFFDTRTRGVYWKYHNAASFTLRRVSATGTVGAVRRTGKKVDYCFRDLTKVKRLDTGKRYAGTPRSRQFGACSKDGGDRQLTLGTSVGWADIYPYRYPQNNLDVTGLAGCFLYTLKADPENELVELSESNNAGSVVVRLPWKGPGRRGCPRATEDPGNVPTPLAGTDDAQTEDEPSQPPAQPEDPYGY